MAREIHTFVFTTVIKGQRVRCVHYAILETVADPIYDVKHVEKLRQFTGLPVSDYTILKGYFPEDEARKKADENG